MHSGDERKDAETPSQPKPGDKSGVLVVGDWLVDEHWVVGKHRAPSSSRTGREHSRALHREDCSVRSLCGAGQVATILHQARVGGNRLFEVYGIGIWHPADSLMLHHMLEPGFNVGRTHHHLADDRPVAHDKQDASNSSERDASNSSGGGRLYSLIPSGVDAGTTRIIRIYRHRGDDVDLDQRIDWELPLTDSDFAKIEEAVGSTVDTLENASPAIEHIFVKDLHKGVVSRKLIASLKDRFPHASWYVSSKQWEPEWFKDLPKSRVRSILIPQLAAQKATNEKFKSSSSWMTSGGVPSEDAIKEINRIANEFVSAKIVVLPEGMRILARSGNDYYALPLPGAADELPFTPMASVFFPALAAYMIASDIEFLEALTNAVAFTTTWEMQEAQRIKEPETWQPNPEQELSLGGPMPPLKDLRKFDWQRLSNEWDEAFSDLGLVSVADRTGKVKEEFQLWRAMTDLEGYVTCMPDKRRHVLTLLRAAQAMKLGDRKAKSFFIVDEPGSGKSFMVERLAATLEMPYMKFNIASLVDKNELPGCFQKISQLQGENPNKVPIIFFDEMNAKKGNETVYDAFLEPLEDGTYNYDGKTFHLQPCLWIFAGTQRPAQSKDKDKGPDFESRLSHEVMYLNRRKKTGEKLPSDEEDPQEDRVQLEQIYIGVATIRSIFPDVTKISKKVLRAFNIIDSTHEGLPDSLKGPRGIRRFVNSFEYVSYGRVVKSNLPKGWNKQMAVDDRHFKSWDKESEGEEVEIKSRAEDLTAREAGVKGMGASGP